MAVIAAAVIIFVLNAGRSSSGIDAIKINGVSISMTYTGHYKRGKPNGEGSCTFGENTLGYLEFEGSWENGGLKSGTLTKTRKDQTGKPIGTRVFKGEFVNNMLNGQGSETGYDENGNVVYVFEGEFEDDKYNGQGKLINYDENGNVRSTFEGEFKDGIYVRDNFIVGIKISDFTYTSEWLNDEPNGQGKAVYENGSVYEGEWKDGMKHGYGTNTDYDENGNVTYVYDGELKNNYPNGYGKATGYDKNGNFMTWSYEGEWKNGDRNGQGTENSYNENGTVNYSFNGEWKDGKQNGQGTETYYYENGKASGIYEGRWNKGKKDGSGVVTWCDENGNVMGTANEVWQNGEKVS